jgi:hypothetical protein
LQQVASLQAADKVTANVNQKVEFLLLNWKRKLSIIQNEISTVDQVFSVRKVGFIIKPNFQSTGPVDIVVRM